MSLIRAEICGCYTDICIPSLAMMATDDAACLSLANEPVMAVSSALNLPGCRYKCPEHR